MDGVDVAITEFKQHEITAIISKTEPYPSTLRGQVEELSRKNRRYSLKKIADLDIRIGSHFADALLSLLTENHISPQAITGIGNHGQTLLHNPTGAFPFTWQIGNSPTIAVKTGIPTAYDFRSVDVARGGQGAPLVPPFHEWLFNKTDGEVIVVNIGGISNISILRQNSTETYGFDCGPGNCLLDLWCQKNDRGSFDKNGAWA